MVSGSSAVQSLSAIQPDDAYYATIGDERGQKEDGEDAEEV